ncbi:YwaF family protein [Mycoplasmopsis ciconiae]|uniref:YwaF family protein n=1 Tax=Mycoplasmopsis ciconiae TaxID=561067 RepID=A0ABU7MNB2_9BACT|nr:YwaF family protein [Mycoplasmopsis ciconiae]
MIEYFTGFFSYPAGNNLPWDGISKKIFFVVSLLLVIAFILVSLFKRPIYNSYHNKANKYLFFKNERTLNFVIGISTLAFVLVRIGILATSNFPNKWEIIPLHLCRLNIVIFSILLIINKTKYLKYILFTSVVGALIALALPDLSSKTNEIVKVNGVIQQLSPKGEFTFNGAGLDNYFFYDYLLAHGFILIAPLVFFILNNQKISLRDFVIMLAIILGLIIFTFTLNSILDNVIPADSKYKEWRSNWFYNGTNEVNSKFSRLIKPITLWPYMIFTQLFFANLFMFAVLGIYMFQDKLSVTIEDKKLKFKIIESQKWNYFKGSLNIKKTSTK